MRDRVLEKVVEASRTMPPGDPLDPATRLGAIVDDVQMKTVLGYIDAGRSEGAVVLAGGGRTRGDGGYYVEPTVFTDVRHDMRIAREEIFGRCSPRSRSRMPRKRSASVTPSTTAWPPQSGPATSARRTGSRGPCGQAWST